MSTGSASPVFKVEQGCAVIRAGMGCGCIGTCHEKIDVVKAEDYWKVVGQRDALREALTRTEANHRAAFERWMRELNPAGVTP